MVLDVEALIAPVSEAEPLGASLRYHDTFEQLRELATAGERPEWARLKDRALQLASEGRDLRVWVWLCRASLCADGLPGLADGLRLIADGCARYWDELPPFDDETTQPLDRFLGRCMALTELGVSNFQTNADTLASSGRNVTDLRADLDDVLTRTVPDEATAAALAGARAAMAAIIDLYKERFGPGNDPQLGFEVLEAKLAELDTRMGVAAPGAIAVGGPAAGPGRPAAGGALAAIGSRDDVIRAFNLILEYYRVYEPSSPVPLMLERAKRLVPMTFVEAMKDIAPGGFHELKTVAGLTDE